MPSIILPAQEMELISKITVLCATVHRLIFKGIDLELDGEENCLFAQDMNVFQDREQDGSFGTKDAEFCQVQDTIMHTFNVTSAAQDIFVAILSGSQFAQDLKLC